MLRKVGFEISRVVAIWKTWENHGFCSSGKVMEKSGSFATHPGKMTIFVAKARLNEAKYF